MSDSPDSSSAEHLPSISAESSSISYETTHLVVSAGSLLRQAREATGLHIAALAVSLKVPVKKLEALEADRFDLLPDVVFVRALASSVCRTLKVDAAPVLERLPRTSSPELARRSSGINAPFRASGNSSGPSVWVKASRPAMLAGLFLVLGTLALILLPAMKTGVDSSGADAISRGANTSSPLSAAFGVLAESISSGVSVPRSSVSSVALSSTEVKSSLSGESSMLTVSPSVPTLLQSLAVPVNSGPSVSLVSPADIVVFSAKGASWVEVTDSKGTVVLRRTLSAGDVVGASGVAPLTAIVGRADATTVQIRGNVFDLTEVAKDNVARFEVK